MRGSGDLAYIVAAVVGYLLGSVPCATLVARRHGVDLSRVGDGNPGAWNVLEALGWRRAWPAFLGDGGKALLAVAAGLVLGATWAGSTSAWWAQAGPEWWVGWTGAAAAMLGHACPLAARGRGGKAVMCFAGAMCLLSPLAAAACVLLCVAVTWARGFAWGARVGVFAVPLVQLATDPIMHVAGTGALMSLIGVLFLVRRRSPARASGAAAAAPRA